MSTQLTSANKNGQLLNNILNLYMVNDSLIHQNLSFILDIILNHRLFNTSAESDELTAIYRKWTVRLNAILQSKITVARWCAIKLVRVTCENSHDLLLSNGKTWSAQLLGFVSVCVYKQKLLLSPAHLNLFFFSIEIRANYYSSRINRNFDLFV